MMIFKYIFITLKQCFYTVVLFIKRIIGVKYHTYELSKMLHSIQIKMDYKCKPMNLFDIDVLCTRYLHYCSPTACFDGGSDDTVNILIDKWFLGLHETEQKYLLYHEKYHYDTLKCAYKTGKSTETDSYGEGIFDKYSTDIEDELAADNYAFSMLTKDEREFVFYNDIKVNHDKLSLGVSGNINKDDIINNDTIDKETKDVILQSIWEHKLCSIRYHNIKEKWINK